jgi:hypothetical protein
MGDNRRDVQRSNVVHDTAGLGCYLGYLWPQCAGMPAFKHALMHLEWTYEASTYQGILAMILHTCVSFGYVHAVYPAPAVVFLGFSN